MSRQSVISSSSSRSGASRSAFVFYVEIRKGSTPKPINARAGDTVYEACHRDLNVDWNKRCLSYWPPGHEVALSTMAESYDSPVAPGQAATPTFKLVARKSSSPLFEPPKLTESALDSSREEDDNEEDHSMGDAEVPEEDQDGASFAPTAGSSASPTPAATARPGTGSSSAAGGYHQHFHQDSSHVGAHAISNSAGAIGGQGTHAQGVNTGTVSGAGVFHAFTATGGGAAAAGRSVSQAAAAQPRLAALADDDDHSQSMAFDTDGSIHKLVQNQKVLYEAQISDFDTSLYARSFFANGLARMRSVVLLRRVPGLKTKEMPVEKMTEDAVRNVTKFKKGTAFLISDRLLMTNWHVIPNKAMASHRKTKVLFDYNDNDDDDDDEQGDGDKVKTGTVNPEFFWSDEELDVAIIGFRFPEDEYQANGTLKDPLARIPIILQSSSPHDQLQSDPRLCILGHPAGHPKKISIHGCRVQAQNPQEAYLVYTNDTKACSSGSPVFDCKWNLIGQHHSAVRSPTTIGNKKSYAYNQGTYSFIIYAKLVEVYKHWDTIGMTPEMRSLLRSCLILDQGRSNEICAALA